jgi:hypothetical protein
MSPAPLPRMSATGSIGITEPSAWEGDVLLPVMQVGGGAPDPVALATWHLALGSTTALEIPNDLFALWVFPASGGAVLLGPAALAQDHVRVPTPAPQLLQDDLYQLEQILRGARYASVIAVPIRHVARDVGVMLLGSFAHGAFGPAQAVALYRVAGQLSSAMAQLAEAMPAVASHAALEPLMTREQLPEYLARAACESASGADLVRRVSGIIYALLPHDRLEILVAGPSDGSWIPLSGNSPRRRWSSTSGGPEAYTDILARFGEETTLLLADLAELESGSEWPVGGSGSAPLPARSVLGARLTVAGASPAFLLLGSVAHDAYRPDDEEILALAGLILAPRVAALQAPPADEREESVSARELPLARAAEALASTSHLGQGLADFAAELGRVLPHEGISLHLRRGEDEVIALDPKAPRPFADLPPIPLAEFEGAAVLRGEREWEVRPLDEAEEVLVPLSVAGRAVGILGVRSREFAAARSAAAIARQFADVLAPHLELLRRGSASGSPGMRERTSVR